MRRRVLAALGAAAAGLATLPGCGFQLRGAAAMPFTTMYIGATPYPVMDTDLRRAVRNTGVRVVDAPDEAEVRLDFPSVTRERDIVAYSTSGRPREYQLRLRARFRVRDVGERELIPPTEIVLRRPIIVADNLGTLNAVEEQLMYRDMENDLVQQMIRRLSAIRGAL